MRRRAIRQPAHAFEAINVTPLIDVVMCLIVFFLIVGKLAADAGSVRLPGTGVGSGAGADASIVVSIAPTRGPDDGSIAWGGARARVYVDGVPLIDEAELEALLSARAAGQPASAAPTLQVRADRDLPYGLVQPALSAAGRAGLTAVRLATERLP